MRVLLLGATGQIGSALHEKLHALARKKVLPILYTALTRDTLDITDSQMLRETLHSLKPNIIINALAMTDVNRAELFPEEAEALNHHAVRVLAKEAQKINALLIHYSTDYVFNGNTAHAYTETDNPDPINHYGASKRRGEIAIETVAPAYIILRVARVYSARRKNFFLAMKNRMEKGERIEVVDDQIGTPNAAFWLAEKTVDLLKLPIDILKERSGIYHLAASGRASWFSFAQTIHQALLTRVENSATQNKIANKIASCAIIPVSAKAYAQKYPRNAPRPKNAVLSNRLFFETFAPHSPAPTWEEVFAAFIKEHALL